MNGGAASKVGGAAMRHAWTEKAHRQPAEGQKGTNKVHNLLWG